MLSLGGVSAVHAAACGCEVAARIMSIAVRDDAAGDEVSKVFAHIFSVVELTVVVKVIKGKEQVILEMVSRFSSFFLFFLSTYFIIPAVLESKICGVSGEPLSPNTSRSLIERATQRVSIIASQVESQSGIAVKFLESAGVADAVNEVVDAVASSPVNHVIIFTSSD
eukprot:TRINITY_DN14670_c0_g1_i1.p1 TRINITY_DN14670_c0_g1~~TRINITY_DN14670_c0_g1_i1.p1  ORF type:complete len:167 (+),score=26.74 TRINITY_DN14670_c0_g1_i1:352-852(+)